MAKAKAPARTELSRKEQEEIIRGGGSVMLADGVIYSITGDLPDTDESLAAAEAELSERKKKAKASTDFEAMTIAELKDYAEKNEIDLTGAKLHADFVAAIKAAEG